MSSISRIFWRKKILKSITVEIVAWRFFLWMTFTCGKTTPCWRQNPCFVGSVVIKMAVPEVSVFPQGCTLSFQWISNSLPKAFPIYLQLRGIQFLSKERGGRRALSPTVLLPNANHNLTVWLRNSSFKEMFYWHSKSLFKITQCLALSDNSPSFCLSTFGSYTKPHGS